MAKALLKSSVLIWSILLGSLLVIGTFAVSLLGTKAQAKFQMVTPKLARPAPPAVGAPTAPASEQPEQSQTP